MDKQIRIIQMIYRFDVEGAGGGIGRFVFELSRALDKNRFEVAICALGNLGKPLEKERILKLNAGGLEAFAATSWDDRQPYPSFLRAVRSLSSLFSRQPADIIHSHSEFGDIAALLLKPGLHPPKILRTVHYGFRYEWRKRPLRRIFFTNFLYPLLLDAEVGVSQSIAHTLNQRPFARLLQREASCIYNAIELSRFTQAKFEPTLMKKSLGIPLQAPVIGSIGRLTEQKGYSDFLKMAAIVLKSLPQAYFIIIGDGELAQELVQQSRQLNIQDRILFTGPRTDIEALLTCMDLFVSSSRWEGLPTVLLESMASGVPVVATDIPGTRELIKTGETGWLAPVNNPESLARTVCEAFQSPQLWPEIVREAKVMVQRFTIQAVAEQYEQLYEKLVTSDVKNE